MDERHSSMVSLQELDPSPVEETPDEKTSDYFGAASEETSSGLPPPVLSRSNTSGLGSHTPLWYLSRVQKYSSYVFTLFTTAHIANTALLPLVTRSVQKADTYLLLTRPYYQSFPLEPILVGVPLCAHILSGVTLRLYRRRQTATRYGAENRRERKSIPWPKLSGTSALGYALVPLVLGHAFVNRLLPLWQEGGNANIGLEYVSHGFAKHPIISFAFYVPLLGVMSWHTTWGWARWLGWSPAQLIEGGQDGAIKRKRRWWTLNGISLAITAVWLAGGLGVVGRGGEAHGWLGKEYDLLFSRIPLIGRWL